MITFFTSLKPFRGTTAVQQNNALRSRRHTVPGSEIVVFGATKGGDEVLAEVETTYRPFTRNMTMHMLHSAETILGKAPRGTAIARWPTPRSPALIRSITRSALRNGSCSIA
jgi:hypothetical protein